MRSVGAEQRNTDDTPVSYVPSHEITAQADEMLRNAPFRQNKHISTITSIGQFNTFTEELSKKESETAMKRYLNSE